MNVTQYEDLFIPGTQIGEFKFNDFWDWFVKVSDLTVHWKNEPTYVLSQSAFILGGLVTLLHALAVGGRLPYLWICTILHGIVVECICYVHPDVDNFWHSQTPVMFFGRRFPLHIVMLYPTFIYTASIAVAKLRLPKWAEPFAVGLSVVLIDIPYDIVSVRYLHWSWHDTDQNIYDRHYWVPWNSYYFHATFAASFTYWFHFTREKICNNQGKWVADKNAFKEIICTLITALLGAPGGILMFIPIYHPLHDIYKIHSEVTFFIIFAIFLLLIWSGDRIPKPDDLPKDSRKVQWFTWATVLHLIVHYTTFLIIPILFNPEDEKVTGLRETIGPCHEYVPQHTAFGMTLQKRKYLCPTDYDEGYFDWRCLPEGRPPSDGSTWYTACGIPLENRAEYITVISLICFVAAVVFSTLHFRSAGDSVFTFKDKVNNKKNVSKKKYN